MRADNFVGFLTALGFFVGVIFCIMAGYEPLELVAYTCVIALIFFLGSHIAIMNYVDASSESKIYFDKEKYEEINEFLIEELFARERRMDAMMQVKRDKLFSKKSSKKKSKKKVDEQATQKAA